MELIQCKKVFNRSQLYSAYIGKDEVVKIVKKEIAFQIAEQLINSNLITLLSYDDLSNANEFVIESEFFICSNEDRKEMSKLREDLQLLSITSESKLEWYDYKLAQQKRIIEVLWQGRKDKQWKSKLPE
jgi:hypothetical protein